MNPHGWKYSGDMNPENGGLWFKLPEHETPASADYAEAVDLVPESDLGGFDGDFLVTPGSVYMPHEKRQTALETCGWKLDGETLVQDFDGQRVALDSPEGFAILVQAFNAYHGVESSAYGGILRVRIGKPGAYDADPNGDPDYSFRGNAKIGNIIKREFLT